MASTSTRKLAKDAAMVGGALLAVWLGLMIVFGTPNPFYVVASGSMVPTLEVHDLLVISAHEDFGMVIPGDIIVFNRPSDNDRVIVHRVAAILDEDPRTIRTKGDANPASIPGTDFPIAEQNYLGTVVHVLPQVGLLPKMIQPPVNYIIIAGIVGFILAKHFHSRKRRDGQPDP